jgi:DnaJ-class molecular chaperone
MIVAEGPVQRPPEATAPCPQCGGTGRQAFPFGMFLFTARYRCESCGAEFERIRLQPGADSGRPEES